MKPLLKTALTYTAALAGALIIHIGLAEGVGGFVRFPRDGITEAEAPVPEETLTLTFHRANPVRLRTEAVASVTRGREPVPMPTPVPEPSSHQPEMETTDPAPASDTEEAAVLNTEPTAAVETDAPAETASQSPMVPQPVRHQKQTMPPARFEKPRPLQPIDAEAVYPLGSRLRGEEGMVRLLARIGSDGRVEGLKIGESSGFPALDRAAEQAVRRTRFSPATQNNRPVTDEITITIRFRLDS